MKTDRESYKLTLFGDSGAGKTKLLEHRTQAEFTSIYKPTISVDFGSELYNKIRLQLWDTGGDVENLKMMPHYMKNCDAIVIAVNLDSKAKTVAEQLYHWHKTINIYCIKNNMEPIIILVGTKSDLDVGNIKAAALQTYAEEHQLGYSITSAKNNSEVIDTFANIMELLINQQPNDFDHYIKSAKAFRYFNNKPQEGEMYYQLGLAYYNNRKTKELERPFAFNFMTLAKLKGNMDAKKWLEEYPQDNPTVHTIISNNDNNVSSNAILSESENSNHVIKNSNS